MKKILFILICLICLFVCLLINVDSTLALDSMKDDIILNKGAFADKFGKSVKFVGPIILIGISVFTLYKKASNYN